MRLTPVSLVLGSLLSVSALVACSDDEDTTSDVSSTEEGADSGVSTTPSTSKDAGTSTKDAATTKDSGGPVDEDAAPADQTAPTVEITSPREDLAIDERVFVVTGTAKDDIGVTSLSYVIGTDAAVSVPVAADGSFTFSFVAKPGKNSFEVTAKDATGNETKATRAAYFGHRISTGNSQAAMLADGKLFTWDATNSASSEMERSMARTARTRRSSCRRCTSSLRPISCRSSRVRRS